MDPHEVSGVITGGGGGSVCAGEGGGDGDHLPRPGGSISSTIRSRYAWDRVLLWIDGQESWVTYAPLCSV